MNKQTKGIHVTPRYLQTALMYTGTNSTTKVKVKMKYAVQSQTSQY